MKFVGYNIVTGSLLGAAMLLGAAACTDDHYDIKTDGSAAGNTIWQNIKQNSELTEVADILQQIKVYRRENDSSDKSGQTYAGLLDASQSLTFYAPKNGTFDYDAVKAELDAISTLRQEAAQLPAGDEKDSKTTEADNREYTLGVQFAQNHIARFNHESEKSNQAVYMLNSKVCYLDAGNGTFNGVKMEGTYPASNGVMHLLDGRSPFSYNVFDYMKSHTSTFSKVYGVLSDPEIDKNEFSESQSIQGTMNSQGQMVYVDSVYVNSNALLDNSHAYIKNEDSIYIAVIPTDKAWDTAYGKIESLYRYGKSYNMNYSSDDGKYATKNQTFNADSLKSYNANQALITNMYFSPGYFSQEFSRTDSAGMINYALYADSLRSTRGTYFYNSNAKGDGTKAGRNPLFGAEDVTPIKASNGYIFAIDDYVFDPSYAYQKKKEISLNYLGQVGYSNSEMVGKEVITLVDGTNWNKEVTGEVENNAYLYVYTEKNKRDATVEIPLRNVLSGKYRVKAILLPNRICTDNMWVTEEKDEESGETTETEDMQETKFTCEIYDDSGTRLAQEKDIEVSDVAVETKVLISEVEFTKCYDGLPSSITNSFPVMRITLPRGNKYRPGDHSRYGLSIAKIVLEPIHE